MIRRCASYSDLVMSPRAKRAFRIARASLSPPSSCRPMHTGLRQSTPGTCLQCGMALVPEGTRFALLHQMLGNPLHLVVMAFAMVVLVTAVMLLMR